MKVNTYCKSIKNFARKLKILLHQKLIHSDHYDEKYVKIKFNSKDDLPLKKLLELYNLIIVFRSVFYEDK